VTGGFLWNYNSEARVLNEWATAINRIFYSREDNGEAAAAKVYSDANYGGYCIELTEGKYTMADLAVLGLKARDLSSLQVTDGYKVTLYKGTSCAGTSVVFTESAAYVGDAWNDAVSSIRVEKMVDGIDYVPAQRQRMDSPIYNVDGRKVSDDYKGIVIKNGRKTVNYNR
jgi:hypothetical protein